MMGRSPARRFVSMDGMPHPICRGVLRSHRRAVAASYRARSNKILRLMMRDQSPKRRLAKVGLCSADGAIGTAVILPLPP
jgi:hypothetical protein